MTEAFLMVVLVYSWESDHMLTFYATLFYSVFSVVAWLYHMGETR